MYKAQRNCWDINQLHAQLQNSINGATAVRDFVLGGGGSWMGVALISGNWKKQKHKELQNGWVRKIRRCRPLSPFSPNTSTGCYLVYHHSHGYKVQTKTLLWNFFMVVDEFVFSTFEKRKLMRRHESIWTGLCAFLTRRRKGLRKTKRECCYPRIPWEEGSVSCRWCKSPSCKRMYKN